MSNDERKHDEPLDDERDERNNDEVVFDEELLDVEHDDDELLDEAAACRLIGGTKPIHPATLRRGVDAGRYSKPIRVSPNAKRWRRRELRADVERMAAERDA
jgi:hypothetical protein